jgi:hypothetical protein
MQARLQRRNISRLQEREDKSGNTPKEKKT